MTINTDELRSALAAIDKALGHVDGVMGFYWEEGAEREKQLHEASCALRRPLIAARCALLDFRDSETASKAA